MSPRGKSAAPSLVDVFAYIEKALTSPGGASRAELARRYLLQLRGRWASLAAGANHLARCVREEGVRKALPARVQLAVEATEKATAEGWLDFPGRASGQPRGTLALREALMELATLRGILGLPAVSAGPALAELAAIEEAARALDSSLGTLVVPGTSRKVCQALAVMEKVAQHAPQKEKTS